MNRFLTGIFFTFAFALGCSIGMGENQAVDLGLPTDNDSLFSGGGAAFYQYIERNYNGVKSTPWEGGQYGFVRDGVYGNGTKPGTRASPFGIEPDAQSSIRGLV